MSDVLENSTNEQTGVKFGNILIFSVVLLTTTGALWFGFNSCGGYGWIEDIFLAALVTFACLTVFASSSSLNSTPKKLAFLFRLPIVYFALSSAGNAIYQQSWSGANDIIAFWLWVINYGRC